MKRTILLLMTFACCFFTLYAADATYQKTSDAIIIHLPETHADKTKTIRLQVINDNIIRVTAGTKQQLSERKSLIASSVETLKGGWTIKESDKQVILQTKSIKAYVSLKTGEVKFTDLQDRVILQENTGGGKTFEPFEVDGRNAYSFRQVFESPDDEAFYGLGQHQSDEFNYKGKNEILYQYNTKVSVPFIVSNKNYGILWDNYSLTKFGDPRDYGQLDQFVLRDKTGKEGGLTATYIVNNDPPVVFVERQEQTIDYENLETVQKFPASFPFNKSTIVWEGSLEPKESGIFRFILYYAGYTKVYVDGELVVPERWRTAWNPNSYKFPVEMEKGKRHTIKLEWKPDGGVSYIGLKALSPVDPAEQNKLSFWSEMGEQIDYYFICGNKMDEVISGYRTVTGKAQVMPKWSMGFWQSRERYKTQNELLGVLKEFRKRNIPVDNIVLDWSYWPENAWGSHDFDAARFPDPKGMVDQVHAMDARIMISVWPKFYHTTDNYKAFDKKGWMYQLAVKDSIRDWIGKGYIGSFYDAYSEGARKLFWEQMDEKLYSKGIDAWWMDASEPDVLSNASIGYRKKLMNPTALGSSTEYFNAYGLMNAQGIYEGQRSVNNNDRVFLLTRSGFAGSQKYAAVIWSGDIGTRWEDMKAQISAGLNFAVSGNPYWTMDNGGFCVEKRYEKAKEGSEDLDEWRELNVRWNQFGAFVPLYRSHGQFPRREIWNIAPEGHPAYTSMLYYMQLRYRLMPYIYTLAGMTHFDDYTIMRPLVMDYSDDTQVLNIGDQYMFGSGLMVCPVYEYKAQSRNVYFPSGTNWYDFYSGKETKGGQFMKVDAPYERIPLFVAAGSIVPMGDQIQHTKQEQKDLTVYVYAGKDGAFNLYEDEGTNYDYEKGAYTIIPLIYNDTAKKLTIGDRKGEYNGMHKERKIKIVYITPDHPAGITKEIQYNGKRIVSTL